ncbi:MAG: OmpH family outer membrane protein [Candidatus Gastranaerophilales bacterium]
MKKNEFMKTLILVGALLMVGGKALASGVGYVDYQKVQENFPYAQKIVKEIDNKTLDLQQYMMDKEKQYKAIETPLKKQNFEEATAKEFKAKEDAFKQYKLEKEEDIYNKIQNASTEVLVEQKLDAIFDYRVIFVGGVDVTDLVVTKLKTVK